MAVKAPKIKQNIHLDVLGLQETKEVAKVLRKAAEASARLAEARKKLAVSSRSVAASEKKINKERRSKEIKKAITEEEKLTLARDEAVRAAKAAERAAKRNTRALKGNHRAAHALSGIIGTLGGSFRNMATSLLFHAKTGPIFALIAAFAALRTVVSLTITPAARFDKAMAQVRKTTGLTAEATDKLGLALIDLSDRLAQPRDQLAKIAEVAGQLGIRGTANLLRFTETVGMLVQVAELGPEQAARGIAKIGQAFEIPITQAQKMGSVINELSNNTTATSAEIIKALGKIGPVAKQLGLTLAETAGMAVTLIDTGLVAPRVGTNLRNLFVLLQAKASQIAKLMNMTVGEFNKALEEDTLPTMRRYLGILKQMESSGQVMHIRAVYGQENFAALQALAELEEILTDNINLANKSYKEGRSLMDEYGKSIDNLGTKIERVGNIFSNVFVRGGLKMKPALERMLETFGELLYPISVLEVGLSDLLIRLEELDAMEPSDQREKAIERTTDAIRRFSDEIHKLKVQEENLEAVQDELVAKRLELWNTEIARGKALGEGYAVLYGIAMNLRREIEALESVESRVIEEQLKAAEKKTKTSIKILDEAEQGYYETVTKSGRSVKVMAETNDAMAQLLREKAKILAEISKMEFARYGLHDPDIEGGGAYYQDALATENQWRAQLARKEQEVKDLKKLIKENSAAAKEFVDALAMMEGFDIEDTIGQFLDLPEKMRGMAQKTFDMLSASLDLDKVKAYLEKKAKEITKGMTKGMVEGIDTERMAELVQDMLTQVDLAISSSDMADRAGFTGGLSQMLQDLFPDDWADRAFVMPVAKATAEAKKSVFDFWDSIQKRYEESVKQFNKGVDDAAKAQADSLKEKMDSLKQTSDLLVQSINDIADAADAFGSLSDGTNDFVRSLTLAIDRAYALVVAVKALRAAQEGSKAAATGNVIGVIASIAGMIGAIVSSRRAADHRAEDQRDEMIEVSKENRRRLEDAIDRLGREVQLGSNFTGDQVADLGEAARDTRDLYERSQDAGLDPDERNRLYSLFLASQARFNSMLESMGLPDIDFTVSASVWQSQIDRLFEEIFPHGKFNDTVDGLLASMELFARTMGIEAPEAIMLFVKGMEGVESIPDWIKEELASFDLSTQEGRDALREWVARQGLSIAAGTFDYGGMTPQEARDILEYARGLSEGKVAGAGGSDLTTLSVRRSISDTQANAILHVLLQIAHWSQVTAHAVSGGAVSPSSGPGSLITTGSYSPPTGTSPARNRSGGGVSPYKVQVGDLYISTDMDPDNPKFGRAVGQAVENLIVRRRARPTTFVS